MCHIYIGHVGGQFANKLCQASTSAICDMPPVPVSGGTEVVPKVPPLHGWAKSPTNCARLTPLPVPYATSACAICHLCMYQVAPLHVSGGTEMVPKVPPLQGPCATLVGQVAHKLCPHDLHSFHMAQPLDKSSENVLW